MPGTVLNGEPRRTGTSACWLHAVGRTDTAARLTSMAAAAAEQASLADAWMVLKAMAAYSAAQSGDAAACGAGAAESEAFALAQGVTVVCAEAAFLWVCAGKLDRAHALVHTFHGPVLDGLPRDVNWLLTLQCVLEAALAVADREVVEKAAGLLAPYPASGSGRALARRARRGSRAAQSPARFRLPEGVAAPPAPAGCRGGSRRAGWTRYAPNGTRSSASSPALQVSADVPARPAPARNAPGLP
jgi:hypothetical protein